MILQILGLFTVFCLITWLSFYPLGYLLISNNVRELESYEIITLSFSASIVMFVLLSIFLSVIGLRFLLIFIMLGLGAFSILTYKLELLSPWRSLFRYPMLLGLLLLGILVQGFINFPSGFLYNKGLLFFSSQGFDGLWHVSLMNSIANGIPPQMMLYSGSIVQNYHYLVDILMGEFNRMYGFFSSLDLYFRFFPVFFSFLMGISVFSFISRWKNHSVAYWAVFFTYFVGSFGYVVAVLKPGNIFGGETAFWASQLNTIIANPPHASAIILLCAFLLSFCLYTRLPSGRWFVMSFLLGAVISGFKVSGGLVLLAGIGTAALIQLLMDRKLSYLALFLALLLSNFITIRLLSKDATSFLIFEPWWFIRTMVVVKLGLIEWELRRQTYLAVGRFTSYLRIIQIEGTALVIFIVGNLGMRIVGFPIIIQSLIRFKEKIIKNPIETFLLAAGFTGFIVPMLFLQKGIVYNSIQFMQYVLLITGFYAAIFTHNLIKKIKYSWLRYIFILVLTGLSVPTVIGNFVEFYGGPANAVISRSEISALGYLKNISQPSDVILTPPFDVNDKYGYKQNPLPIYAWAGTPYVSALTDRTTYLSGEDQLIITGYDVDSRLSLENSFFSQKDFVFNKSFLRDNKIAYLYIPNPKKYSLDPRANGLEQVYSNDEVIIYKVM